MLREVVTLFLKLGVIGFGGPAAHIALMRDEVVRRRRWVDDARFLDLLGMTNLIPGPNSTEMAIHLGYVRAGWPGLLLGGAAFIVPAMITVLALAWAYVAYGARPEASAALYGIKPVIIAIVLHAAWALTRTAVKTALLGVVAVVSIALYAAGAHELAILLGAGGVTALARAAPRRDVAALLLQLPATGGAAVAVSGGVSLGALCLVFLKIGAVLYGSGYVLLAFLRSDLVERYHWLSDRQLLDAVAIGQFTPGPVFTTATFIGYVLAGWVGGVLATIAIFLPSFVFVALSQPLVPWIRRSAGAAAFLDGVNAAALGLMLAVTGQLARAAVVDAPTLALGVIALLLLLRFRVNSAWLVAGGAAIGLALHGRG
ncbi:MAG TPA: chromate efflux transporter [Methylomirabilota bacterium]|jgi:chromate transporter|nr:chromate efflux transporter [Methylomirabilota bacterium]